MAVVKPPDTPQRASDAKTAKPQSFQKTPPDWWGPEWSVVWATLILAMVGAFQLAMFFVQLRYMRKGINDANAASEVARKAAEAAYLSASAGIEANKISQELFVSGERPWISANVTPASDLTVTPDGRCILHIRTTLKNHGKSPALSVKYVVGFVEYTPFTPESENPWAR